MISEVLQYLLMITCMLIRVSSKEVKWAVCDTSPKLGQGLTLFCKVDNCTVHETKRWYGGPDDKVLMLNSGISTDKTKYNTSIEKHGFILTILNLAVKDLNVSYECSCGLYLDKHILYIEDVHEVNNLNKSTNGTNYVGTNDGSGIYLTSALPITLVIFILLFVVFIVVMKKRGSLKRLKEKFGGSRIKKSDTDECNDSVALSVDEQEGEDSQIPDTDECNDSVTLSVDEQEGDDSQISGEDDNTNMREVFLITVDVDSDKGSSVRIGHHRRQGSGSTVSSSVYTEFNRRKGSGSTLSSSVYTEFNRRKGSGSLASFVMGYHLTESSDKETTV